MGGEKEWGIANVVVAFGLRLCSSGVLINSYTLSAGRWPLFVVSLLRKSDHPRDSPSLSSATNMEPERAPERAKLSPKRVCKLPFLHALTHMVGALKTGGESGETNGKIRMQK